MGQAWECLLIRSYKDACEVLLKGFDVRQPLALSGLHISDPGITPSSKTPDTAGDDCLGAISIFALLHFQSGDEAGASQQKNVWLNVL